MDYPLSAIGEVCLVYGCGRDAQFLITPAFAGMNSSRSNSVLYETRFKSSRITKFFLRVKWITMDMEGNAADVKH